MGKAHCKPRNPGRKVADHLDDGALAGLIDELTILPPEAAQKLKPWVPSTARAITAPAKPHILGARINHPFTVLQNMKAVVSQPAVQEDLMTKKPTSAPEAPFSPSLEPPYYVAVGGQLGEATSREGALIEYAIEYAKVLESRSEDVVMILQRMPVRLKYTAVIDDEKGAS